MKPKIMFVRLSENCNAGCFMCNFAHAHGKYNISDEKFNWLLDELKKQKNYEMVRFTGGEPLLHKHLIEYINICGSNDLETSIITNGYLLPNYAEKLAGSLINEIIISIDGSNPEIHDKLRGLPNGLERIKIGVNKIKELNPNIVFRANTVVSELNIKDLNNIYCMLDELGFNCWSIIPIRPTQDKNTKWNDENKKENIRLYKEFLSEQKKHSNIDLLGYSKEWAGISTEEIENTFANKFRLTPKKKCGLVDLVRFYIPDQNLIIPCNCAAHRIHQIDTEYSNEKDIFKKADIMADWLKENGKNNCSGCEPLNAYLGDNVRILKKGSYKF